MIAALRADFNMQIDDLKTQVKELKATLVDVDTIVGEFDREITSLTEELGGVRADRALDKAFDRKRWSARYASLRMPREEDQRARAMKLDRATMVREIKQAAQIARLRRVAEAQLHRWSAAGDPPLGRRPTGP